VRLSSLVRRQGRVRHEDTKGTKIIDTPQAQPLSFVVFVSSWQTFRELNP
jgi:hypothetical protein